ncbi:MAG: hypothetical protein DCC55_12050 [Chloroflexi bacterium]|nr:MAG: hypothetical protein DCC55_12050 [Chloroflexota bacterium]
MTSPESKRSRWMSALAIVAILFGLLTIISGGRTLFDTEVQRLAGNYVPFVLWFNFLAGFAYVVAGVGLWFWQRWAMWLSFAIAAATLIIFVAFGVQIWTGGSYEMRTVAAMGLRTITWLVIFVVAYRKLANTQYQVTV